MAKKNNHSKILITASNFTTVRTFLPEFLSELSLNFDVYVATNLSDIPQSQINDLQQKSNFHLINIPIKRKINFFFDLYALFKLILLIHKFKFEYTLSITPKAGLLTSISSFINLVKFRIHIFNGQIWYNKKLFYRFFLKSFDYITFTFSNKILCESFTQANFLKKEGFTKKIINIIHYGSLMGVDTKIYKPNNIKKNELKSYYNLNKDTKICMFVGRINFEKGINLILKASDYFSSKENIFFILIGETEISSCQIYDLINNKKNLLYLGKKNNIFELLNIADFITLPSSREGFGISVIEAASVEKPALVSNISGLKDTVIDKKTGFLFKSEDQKDFNKKLEFMFDNIPLLKRMGRKARINVINRYEKKIVINHYVKFIKSLKK